MSQGLQFDMPESACQSDKDDGYITSGGGVSVRTNSTPAWQARQVSNYFANYKSDLAPGYNPIGRYGLYVCIYVCMYVWV